MRLTPEELNARKRRNLALAGALVAFMILVFAATVLNLRRNIAAQQPGEIPAASVGPAAVVPPGPAPATAQSPSLAPAPVAP